MSCGVYACACVYTRARSLACVSITINELQTRELMHKLCCHICTKVAQNGVQWQALAVWS